MLGSLPGHGELRLARRSQDPDLKPGQVIELLVNEVGLLHQAWRGYGLPLLGMLSAAWLLNGFGNLASAVGAMAGTLLALLLSKRLGSVRTDTRLCLRLLEGADE